MTVSASSSYWGMSAKRTPSSSTIRPNASTGYSIRPSLSEMTLLSFLITATSPASSFGAINISRNAECVRADSALFGLSKSLPNFDRTSSSRAFGPPGQTQFCRCSQPRKPHKAIARDSLPSRRRPLKGSLERGARRYRNCAKTQSSPHTTSRPSRLGGMRHEAAAGELQQCLRFARPSKISHPSQHEIFQDFCLGSRR